MHPFACCRDVGAVGVAKGAFTFVDMGGEVDLPCECELTIKAHRKPVSRRRKTQPVACIAQDGVVLTAEGSGHRALGIGQVGFFRKDPLIDAFLQEAEDRF